MKNIFISAAALLLLACSCNKQEPVPSPADDVFGELVVSVKQEVRAETKATDYVTVLDNEKAEKSVTVMVFDATSGALNMSKKLGASTETCSISVPVGSKTVYAVVNGPDLSAVTTVQQLLALVDDLATSSISKNGFTMLGTANCTVTKGTSTTAAITVSRLVSRVVLRKLTNSLPAAYDHMTIDAVYLGNANTVQKFSGAASTPVNIAGYADAAKSKPIGKNNVTGACAEYLYKKVSADVAAGKSYTTVQHMYCQPNTTSEYTTMYILTTIGANQYYYKVPLNKKLSANYTYSVDVNIYNLGTQNPDDELEKGSLAVKITVADWVPGDDYVAEF